ncbi:MAG TPA: PP2C family protein-serine/threonine phosphatase [Candidatus Acidoferrum sp.]|jgi:serine phosphatase RsbU (regulator of sigma subunit)|nr:PP2C family protein-serine/threonine phosphatase [Candidatus Acidoferrum sp.]
MSPRASFLRTVPRTSLVVFLIGVFLLFSIFGIAEDMAAMGQQPLMRYVLTILVIGTCAVGYAAAGFAMRGRAWKVMIPLFLAEAVLINFLHQWFPSAPAKSRLDPSALAALQTRLNLDAFLIMAITFLGYGCFLYASITEGRRYFRAHAEIALAQEIHRVLVPVIETKLGEFAFYGKSSPSGEVGGDLIDLAGAAENWVAYVADVSGHGVAPGLVMGMVKSAARMLLSSGDSAGHLMPRLNEVLYPLKKPDMFITFCFAAWSAGSLRVGLAGHPSILHFCPSTGEIAELPCPNMPLGILPSADFASSEVAVESGALLALYTDGFLEATNAAGEQFGLPRLKAELLRHATEPLEAICAALQQSVARHGAQFDDQSILLIRKLQG